MPITLCQNSKDACRIKTVGISILKNVWVSRDPLGQVATKQKRGGMVDMPSLSCTSGGRLIEQTLILPSSLLTAVCFAKWQFAHKDSLTLTISFPCNHRELLEGGDKNLPHKLLMLAISQYPDQSFYSMYQMQHHPVRNFKNWLICRSHTNPLCLAFDYQSIYCSKLWNPDYYLKLSVLIVIVTAAVWVCCEIAIWKLGRGCRITNISFPILCVTADMAWCLLLTKQSLFFIWQKKNYPCNINESG